MGGRLERLVRDVLSAGVYDGIVSQRFHGGRGRGESASIVGESGSWGVA